MFVRKNSERCPKASIIEFFSEVAGHVVYNFVNTEFCQMQLTFQNNFQNTWERLLLLLESSCQLVPLVSHEVLQTDIKQIHDPIHL